MARCDRDEPLFTTPPSVAECAVRVTAHKELFQLVGNLGQCGVGAGCVLVSPGSTADGHRADELVTDLNRQAAHASSFEPSCS